jgi:hypothetical protein
MRVRSIAMCVLGLLANSASAHAVQPQIDTLRALPTYLSGCWVPPPLKPGHLDSKITVLMSFKRSGDLLGKPRVTFQSPGPTEDELATREATALALIRCTPLPITDALGGAIAGRPFRMTFDIKTGRPI